MSNIINTVQAKYNDIQANYIKSKEEVKATIASKIAESDAKFAGKKIKMALAHAYITVSSYMKPSHVGKTLAFRGIQVALASAAISISVFVATHISQINTSTILAKNVAKIAIIFVILNKAAKLCGTTLPKLTGSMVDLASQFIHNLFNKKDKAI